MDYVPNLSTREGRDAHFLHLLKEAEEEVKNRPILHRRKKVKLLDRLRIYWRARRSR